MSYKKIRIFLLLCMSLTYGYAQQVFTAAGGDNSGPGGSVSYSIGTVVYKTNAEAKGSEAQGAQQPYEISVVTGIHDVIDSDIDCSVYPNPASELLTLKIKNYDYSGLSLKLFDSNGKLLMSKKAEGNETSIPLYGFVPATYFLKIYLADSKEIKTFKIVKYK
jgi:hypothetical protein